MLSILIPSYHYNAYPLVVQLEQQAVKTGINFELICIDDGSFSHLNIENQQINSLLNCKFIEAKINVGRTATRQRLAKEAQYDWLLFLDVDVKPKFDNLIENYIQHINSEVDAVFGGFAYYDKVLSSDKTLRHTFGKHREEIDASIRNKKPYKVIISANYMIRRKVFLELNAGELKNIYGLDYLFGSRLKQHNIKIKHINNEAFHLGIDDNLIYLEKSKKSIDTLLYLYKSKKIKSNSISLLKAYNTLRFIGLSKLFGGLMLRFNKNIEGNLTGPTPNLFLFDLYRLGYFCRIES